MNLINLVEILSIDNPPINVSNLQMLAIISSGGFTIILKIQQQM